MCPAGMFRSTVLQFQIYGKNTSDVDFVDVCKIL